MPYTLVRHSAHPHDYQFQRAVESTSVADAEAKKVKKAGGVVFDSYGAASAQEYRENYPPEVQGMIPRCRGSFSRQKVGGLAVYLPGEDGLVAPTTARERFNEDDHTFVSRRLGSWLDE